MISFIIKNQWKQSTRSPVWGRTVGFKILIGFLLVYFSLTLGFLGYFLNELLRKIDPYTDPITTFHKYVLYYFIMDLFLRSIIQKVPLLSVEPYLHLPVNKSSLVHFMLGKSLLSFFNVIPLFFILPFAVKEIAYDYSLFTASVWLMTLMLITLGNSYFALLLKKLSVEKPFAETGILLLLAIFFGLDFYNIFELTAISAKLFNYLLYMKHMIVLGVVYLVMFYYMDYRYYLKNMYLEELHKYKKTIRVSGEEIKFMSRFGDLGQLILLQLKLIWRNKRPRSALTVSAFMLFYGLFFYPQDSYQGSYIMFLFVGIMITVTPIAGFGNFLLSWDSSFFDFLLTRRISAYKYLYSKYLLLVVLSTTYYILTTPYIYFGWDIFFTNTVTFLFNIGVSLYIIMAAGIANKKRINLALGAAFNYEGVNATQFLIFIPLLLLPQIIMIPFYAFDTEMYGLALIGFIGLLGVAFHKVIIRAFARKLVNNKHIIADSFRIN